MPLIKALPHVGLSNAHRHWQSRAITRLVFPDDSYIQIGERGILLISAYSEPGEMAPTIWFEALEESGEFVRHNGSHVASIRFVELEE